MQRQGEGLMRRWIQFGLALSMATVAKGAHGEPPTAAADPAARHSAVAAPTPQESGEAGAAHDGGSACVPPCRTGYVCVEGSCVEACNPPCSAEERCTAAGECKAVSTPDDVDTSDSYAPLTTDPYSDDNEDWVPVEPPPATRRKSTGAMVTGIVFAGLGGLLALNGLVLMSLPEPECTSTYGGEEYCSGTDWSGTGTTLLVAGGVLVLVGVPLIVYGSSREPAPRAIAHQRVQPSLMLGPGSVHVKLTW